MNIRRPLTVEDWFGILRRRVWLLVVPVVLCAVGAVLVSYALPRQYTSHTRVLVEAPIVPDDYVKPVVSDDLNRRLASMQGEILSRTHLQDLVDKFRLYPKDSNRVPMEVLVERLRKSINVAPLPPTPGTNSEAVLGFNIDVTLNQAGLAQQVCTEIASMFMDQNLRLRQQQAEDTTQFLRKQLDDAKGKLDEEDAKLATFQNQYVGAQPEDEQTNLTVLAGLTPQLEAVTQSLNEAQENKAFTESMLSQQANALKSSGGINPQTQDQHLSDLQSQLATLRARYTDKHPEVLKLAAEVADAERKMQAPAAASQAQTSVQTNKAPVVEPLQLQQLRAQLHQAELTVDEKKKEQAQLQQQIKTLQGRIQLTPLVQQQYKSLTRDYQTALDFYNDLLKKRDEAQMATELELRQEGENFRVLDPPSLPERPSFPDRRLFLLGGLAVGLGLGAGLAKVAEMRDKTLRKVRDVETLLGVPTLAVITSANPGRTGKADAEMIRVFDTLETDPRSVPVR
jgi:polysaccharide chain length determinant protein (PEP-CTERM system associated)